MYKLAQRLSCSKIIQNRNILYLFVDFKFSNLIPTISESKLTIYFFKYWKEQRVRQVVGPSVIIATISCYKRRGAIWEHIDPSKKIGCVWLLTTRQHEHNCFVVSCRWGSLADSLQVERKDNPRHQGVRVVVLHMRHIENDGDRLTK